MNFKQILRARSKKKVRRLETKTVSDRKHDRPLKRVQAERKEFRFIPKMPKLPYTKTSPKFLPDRKCWVVEGNRDEAIYSYYLKFGRYPKSIYYVESTNQWWMIPRRKKEAGLQQTEPSNKLPVSSKRESKFKFNMR